MEKRVRFIAAVQVLFLLCAVAAMADDRTIDGSYNNLSHPDWGKAGSILLRENGPDYTDGVYKPAGLNRPSPRLISNTVMRQDTSIPNTLGRSDYIWAWGQFIDHDLDLTEAAIPSERFDIIIPAGDPVFDPNSAGGAYFPFERSQWDPNTGKDENNPRQQVNVLTSWMDASMVYGSDPCRAAWLRTGIGGRLKVTSHPLGSLLPYNDGTQPNAGGPDPSLFVAGDVRANEHAILTSLHTLFVREHNRLAAQIASANSGWSDEQIYQKARKIVGAEVQVITFKEFLPALLGNDAPAPYGGYKPDVDGTIHNSFSAAAFRFGHSALSPVILRLDENLQEIPYGHIILEEAFFNPSLITEEGGIEPILRGLTYQLHQQIDAYIVDGVRNNLFATLDLPALNMQRGRDHGLPDYNTLRTLYGLGSVSDFNEINTDPKIWSNLTAVYGTLDNVDPWVGMIAEGSDGTSVGGLRHTIIKKQFENVRDGDRFWYSIDPDLDAQDLAFLENLRLKDVIEMNTGIQNMPENVFYVPEGPTGDELEPTAAVIFPGKCSWGCDIMAIYGGSLDAVKEDLLSSDYIYVSAFIDEQSTPVFSQAVRVSSGTFKYGVYAYYNSYPEVISHIKLDFVNKTFYVIAKNLKLSGLQNSITIEIKLGGYTGTGSTSNLIWK